MNSKGESANGRMRWSTDSCISRRISVLTSATVEFGVIPKEHWYQPDGIDETKATASRKKMQEANIIYGGSYHCFCVSSFFF
jgi:alpha 1,2-mannosyltransferase